MTTALIVAVIVLAAGLIALSAVALRHRLDRTARSAAGASTRILFPFTAGALSSQALDASLRLARAEHGTLVPVFLAQVSKQVPLDTPIPNQGNLAMPLQETIERRAGDFDIPVDPRIERGRTYRHALRQMINHERYDQIVIAASANGGPGFGAGDVAWLLDTAPGEIIVLRANDDGPHPSGAPSS